MTLSFLAWGIEMCLTVSVTKLNLVAEHPFTFYSGKYCDGKQLQLLNAPSLTFTPWESSKQTYDLRTNKIFVQIFYTKKANFRSISSSAKNSLWAPFQLFP